MPTLILATGNPGKRREIAQMLGASVAIKTLIDMPDAPEIVEDGDTFEANAIKKARILSQHAGRPALADDSGLEVDALNGAPGVYSARFAGPNATDAANNAKLLSLLSDIPDVRRTARFRCAMAIALPNGQVQTASGAWEGRILHAPRGTNGFGYDPLFFVPECGLTAAELPAEEKNRRSHRGSALRAMYPHILVALREHP